MQEPSLVRRGLKADNTATEVELLSGDRVDVVSVAGDQTIAIERNYILGYTSPPPPQSAA